MLTHDGKQNMIFVCIYFILINWMDSEFFDAPV